MIRNYLILLFLFPFVITAQSYDSSLGIRLGTDWGATAQLRLPVVHKNFVVEGILLSSLQRDEGSITILGKQHRPLLSRRLNLFYGAGVHAGWNNEVNVETGEEIGGPLGIDGVVGLEATIGKVNLSYDFKPAINIGGGEKTLYAQTGVSIRYVIAKRNTIWDKQKEKAQRKNRKQRQRAKRKEQRRKDREAAGKKWFEFWKKG